MPQSFSDYEQLILNAVQGSTDEQRAAFISGVLSRLVGLLNDEDEESLNEEELEIHHQLLTMVTSKAMDWKVLAQLLDRLTEIAEEDEDHAIDVDPNIVEFWSALGNYREYVAESSPEALRGISENILNVLDYYYTDDTPLSRWLETPEIRTEFERQMQELGARV